MTHIPYQLADVPDRWTGWIAGRIVPPAPLIAPITRRACVYYDVLANPGGGALGNQREGVEFAIEDGSGRAIVELGPGFGEGFVEIDYDWNDALASDDERVRLDAFLVRHGMSSAPHGVREGVLQVGERVLVHGRMLREPDHDPSRVGGYRELPPTRVRVASASRVLLFVSELAQTD